MSHSVRGRPESGRTAMIDRGAVELLVKAAYPLVIVIGVILGVVGRAVWKWTLE